MADADGLTVLKGVPPVVIEPDGAVVEAYIASRARVKFIQGPVGSGKSTASWHALMVNALMRQRPAGSACAPMATAPWPWRFAPGKSAAIKAPARPWKACVRPDDNKGNRNMLDDSTHNLAPLRSTDVIRRGAASPVTPSAPNQGPEAPDEAQALPVRKHSPRWYVVMHKPFEGARARRAIRELGFDVHWPREIKRQARANDVIEPVFPGYLFVRFDERRGGWAQIRRLDHVAAICGLREHGRPIPLPRGEVEALIARAGGMDGVIDCTGDAEPIASLPKDGGRLAAMLDSRRGARAERGPWRRLDALESLIRDAAVQS